MSTVAALLHYEPVVTALFALVAVAIIGVGIWIILPRRANRADDIERQIATLRKNADHAVATRPRVRAGQAVKPKACGGGTCRHQGDCSDLYCPGRLAANLSAGDDRAHR